MIWSRDDDQTSSPRSTHSPTTPPHIEPGGTPPVNRLKRYPRGLNKHNRLAGTASNIYYFQHYILAHLAYNPRRSAIAGS